MRQRLISLLAYPRQLIRDQLELEDCRHSGQYDPGDPACIECTDEAECRWLYSNDEFAALDHKPWNALLDALEYALGFVGGYSTRNTHDQQRCGCDACSWLREAEALYAEIQANPDQPF
jgi:hypothetical protein